MRKDNIRVFREIKGLKNIVPINKQKLIYYTCLDFKEQPKEVQQRILSLCAEVGGEDQKELYEFLTVDHKTADCIARQHFSNEKRLYTLRKKFFEKWYLADKRNKEKDIY